MLMTLIFEILKYVYRAISVFPLGDRSTAKESLEFETIQNPVLLLTCTFPEIMATV
jgi:hypothetical protein